MYHSGPKFLDRLLSDQGLHCLLFPLRLLDALLCGKAFLARLYVSTGRAIVVTMASASGSPSV